MRRTSISATVGVFTLGKFAMNTATRFVYAFLPAIARGLGVSLASAGVLTSIRWGVGAATPAAVRIAGREHRRRIVLAGLAAFMAGALVTAATGVYAGAVLGFILMGFGKPLFDSGTQAFVGDNVPYERRARVVGVMETMWAVSLLVGAPLAGWLIARSGWSTPFWATAALAGGVAIALSGVDLDRGDVPDDAATFVWDRQVVGFFASTALLVASAEMVFVTFAAWLEDTHGFTIGALAVTATVIGVAELIAEGAVVAVTDRLGKRRSVLTGLALAATAFVVLAAGQSSMIVGVGALVLGIAGFEFAFVSSITVGTELRPEARIQLLSRFVVSQAVGRAVGAVAALALFEIVGIGAVGIMAAAVVALAVPFVIVHYPDEVRIGEPAS